MGHVHVFLQYFLIVNVRTVQIDVLHGCVLHNEHCINLTSTSSSNLLEHIMFAISFVDGIVSEITLVTFNGPMCIFGGYIDRNTI